jgi:biotin carboxylase
MDHPSPIIHRLLLLLPATTYRADAFLEAAGRLNLAVTIGTPAALWPQTHRPPDLLALNFNDETGAIRTVMNYAKAHPIDLVIGVDDATVVLAAALSEALGLPHNAVTAVRAARNKQVMRELLQVQRIPVPAFAAYSIHDDPERLAERVAYPCVVKPLVLSASCGVIRANDAAEFIAAFRRVATLLERLGLPDKDEATRKILVEEFVPGREVALEGLLTDGRLRVLALFDKPDPLDGPFFEETIYVTPSRLAAAVQTALAGIAERAALALGLREGPMHAELRVNDYGVWVIEVAARSIGGRCSRTLQFATETSPDMSLEELILCHALRRPLPSVPAGGSRASGVMMLPIPKAGVLEEVQGEDEARAVPGIEELTITTSVGQELVPLPEGTRYLGFLIARGETPELVEAALREAHGRLHFVISAPSVNREQSPRRVLSF